MNAWQPVNLTPYLTGDGPQRPQPTILTATDGLATFTPATNNSIVGDPESGKTWVGLAAGAETLLQGGSFAFIDLDHNGAHSVIERLRILQVNDSTIADPARFIYADPEDAQEINAMITALCSWKTDLVVIDSLGELLPLFGASSNSPDDFTTVNRQVNARLARAGCCVIGIDHLSKGEESRKMGATGTLAKKRAIDGVLLRCTVKDPFTPGRGGSANLTIEKDRHGALRAGRPQERRPLAGTFKLTPDNFGRSWVLFAPEAGSTNPVDQPGDDDKLAIMRLDPEPSSVKEARERLGWRQDRASKAMRWYRLHQSDPDAYPLPDPYPVMGHRLGKAKNETPETVAIPALPVPPIRGRVMGKAHEKAPLPVTTPLGKVTGHADDGACIQCGRDVAPGVTTCGACNRKQMLS